MAAPQPRHKRPGPIRSRCLHRAVLGTVAAAITAVVATATVLAGEVFGPLGAGVFAALGSFEGAVLIVSAAEATTRMRDRRVAAGRRCRARREHPHP